jgi:hypothetical protein
MVEHNAKNERIKRQYFVFLKEAKRHIEATVDAVAKALARFEVYSKFRDFKAFHTDLAVALDELRDCRMFIFQYVMVELRFPSAKNPQKSNILQFMKVMQILFVRKLSAFDRIR